MFRLFCVMKCVISTVFIDMCEINVGSAVRNCHVVALVDFGPGPFSYELMGLVAHGSMTHDTYLVHVSISVVGHVDIGPGPF